MLNIGNKTYRNMQEQVAYNTECIKKLDEYLDGITIEDKLVVIETDSGTFTDEELVLLSGPLAFISDNSRVWMKDSESLTQLVFKAIDIKATEVGGTYFTIGGSKITVNRETGAYVTSSDTIISVYDKSQIDAIVSNLNSLMNNYALLSGATFTGEVKATKLEQSEANWSADLVNTETSNADKIITNIYNRCIVINNILHIIINVKMENISGGALDMRTAFASNITLPATIASKIFDFNGTPASQASAQSYVRIAIANAYVTKTADDLSSNDTPTVSWKMQIANRQEANRINIGVGNVSSYSVPAGETRFVTARIALTLL